MDKKKQIISYRKRYPHWTLQKIAQHCDCSLQYVSRIISAYNAGYMFTDGNMHSLEVAKYSESITFRLNDQLFILRKHDVPRLIKTLTK